MNDKAADPSSRAANERLFTAVRLSPELRGAVGGMCRSLSRELSFAKWTHEEDYHITLQFLGDTDTRSIPELVSALKWAAADFGPFTLSLRETGVFGPSAAPRVLWAGVGGETDRLRELHHRIVAATRPLGFQAEERAYKPHVTLARKYRGERAFASGSLDALTQEAAALHMSWRVEDWVLFVTRMHHKPMYEIVETITI
ncbi:2'-5' RNA ligase [Paenibacillus forsythiae]|uniref:RNA 2',3'-cyclic phosphodiesterase n=1 Tax=Paenibacillus forsythiae TaxID=365616 RepID=A0ABU3H8L0_9BACL|nr:RNA 2',3'-cyclic phosphodiesterase [Paenibacillus forsythiae]MDT3427164.1 2'-5' RNA ligase [Paenibacillus forsythiae]